MRSFSIVVLAVGIVAWIGFLFLGDRPALSAAERERGAVIAEEAVEGESGGLSAELSGKATAMLASLTGGAKAGNSMAGDSNTGDSKSADSNEPSAAPAKSAFYQWVDERGSVNFAASLDEVPAAWRERAGRVEIDDAAFTVTKTASSGVALKRRAPPTPTPTPEVAPNRNHDVVVYTAPWCGWCQKTMAFLDERGVDYDNKDIESDPEYESELRAKTGGIAIPLVEIDGEQIRGFSANRMAELLD